MFSVIVQKLFHQLKEAKSNNFLNGSLHYSNSLEPKIQQKNHFYAQVQGFKYISRLFLKFYKAYWHRWVRLRVIIDTTESDSLFPLNMLSTVYSYIAFLCTEKKLGFKKLLLERLNFLLRVVTDF